MVRWVVRLGGLLVLAVGLLGGLVLPSSSGDAAPEETSITDYRATFDLAADGDLEVVETLSVDFPYYGKHGIFRFFDLWDDNAPGARRIPHDLTVTLDGNPESMEVLTQGRGRYRVARIGSPDLTVAPGVHVYEISYRIDGVLLPGSSAESSRFYWNLVPGGWRQSIERAELVVHLPAAAESVRCGVGVGDADPCERNGDLSGDGTRTLRITTGPLAPRTPVTLRTDLAVPPVASGDSLPWPRRLDGVLGGNRLVALLVLGAAVGAGTVGYLLSRGTREPQPPFPLLYEPPAGIGPAQAQYVLTEKVGREAFVASIMQAAEKGAVDLTRSAGGWSIVDKAGAAGWAGLDRVTSGMAGLLTGPHSSFTANGSDVQAGERLKRELGQFETNTKAWARAEGMLAPAGLGSLGGLAVLASAALSVYLLFADPWHVSAVALVPGLFAVGGVELLVPGAGTRRTARGRDLWSRVGGFRRVLATPSAIERFDFSGRQELYTAYLPWAVALGCAAEWAQKYRTEMGAEPPVPAYFGGGYYGGAGTAVDQMLGDFSSTLSSAISSYEATQSSSSSGGGGGFSGGGGGGGGGGGSW